jgi:tRNA(Ile)-lysidine synthase
LLPGLIADYEPAIHKTVSRSMEILAAESDYIRREAEGWLARKRRLPFDRLHPALQRQCLRLQLITLSVPADFQLVEQLRLIVDQPVTVSPGVTVTRDLAGGVRRRESSASEFNPSISTLVLDGASGSTGFDGLTLKWRRLPVVEIGSVTRSKPGREYYDLAKVGGTAVLRHWQTGDRFQPIGLSKPVKLQDLFTNAKIPREKRRKLVLGANGAGEIFWVEGLRISEGFKVSNGTNELLEWKWVRK